MALGLFSPLSIRVDLEERPYKLGEEIDFRLELKPRGQVEVREGRIDLVCEENYIETTLEVMPDLTGGSHGTTIGNSSVPLGRVPKRITKKHRNRFVHSSVVFLANAQLSAGLASDHSARLLIRPEAPAHASDGKVKWTLEITADLAGSRDITQKKPITVTTF